MDFTALGDAVNVGARLQAHASPGEVVLASDLFELVAADHPARGWRASTCAVATSRCPSRC